MTTIAARYVRRPRRRYRCEWCNRLIDGPHVYAYGHADDGNPPFGVRMHPTEACCPSAVRDPKIRAVLASVPEESTT